MNSTKKYGYGLELRKPIPIRPGWNYWPPASNPSCTAHGFPRPITSFAPPTLSEAIEQQIADGAKEITVISTMFTPGGSHSEYEIPEEMAELRQKYPYVTLTYAWPFDLDKVAEMLCEHLDQFQDNPVG